MNYLDKAGLDALWAKIKNEYVSTKGGVVSGDITLDGINTGSLIVRGDARFIGAVYAPTFTGNLVGNASTATKATQDADGNVFTSTYATKTQLTNGSVTKVGTSTVGGTTTPIYLKDGVPTALGYTIAKSVPSNAVFTDTWRPVVNNLTSDSTDSSLSAAQGKALKALIDALPTPMQFKGSLGAGGTITSLPTASASNEGYTYKVITNGTYASQAAKIGDVFISNGTAWVLVPSGDEPSGTVTSVGVSVPTGLSVSNTPITTSGTIAISLASGYSIPTTTKQAAWDAKQDAITTSNKLAYSLISGTPTSLPASDVSAWAKKSSLAASDVPTLAISKIDGLQTALDGKLNLSGGTMTGVVTLTSGSPSAFDKSALSFVSSNSSTEQARIGTDVYNGLGLYAKGNIYLRPSSSFASSTLGLVISNTNLTYNGNAVYHTGNKPTKSDVGLGNVDNTADANKSVNYATSAGTATNASNDISGTALAPAYGTWRTNLGNPSLYEIAFLEQEFDNKLAFYPYSALLFEKSSNGTTWETETVSEAQARKLFGGDAGAAFAIPNLGTIGEGYRRITITCQSYVYLNCLYIYGTKVDTLNCKVEGYNNTSKQWETWKDYTSIVSWPGHSVFRHSTKGFSSGGTNQYSKVRLSFYGKTSNASYINNLIDHIKWYGGYPAGRRTLFYTDYAKNVSFPAGVSATTGTFSSNVTVGGTLGVTGAATFSTGINLTEAKYIQFRPTNSGYYTTMRYDTNGNEALILGMKNSLTSFIVKSGDSGTTSTTTSGWTGITPSLQVKGQSVYINELIANGSVGAYNFKVNGTACIVGATTLSSNLSVGGSITASGNIQSTKGVSALGIASLDVSSATGSIYVTGIKLGSSTNTLIPSDGIVTLTTATSSADGIMSKTDKAKLDGIASGATANVGTVTSIAIKMNGSTKGTITSSGTIDLGTVITAHQDISGKQDKITTSNKLDASLISNFGYQCASEGFVSTIKVGTATYTTSQDGTINLPAYPTSLPANGGNSATVNGLTVLTAVPANAVFTDSHDTNSAGTGISVSGTRGSTIAISSDYQTKISNGVTAYGWGNHANAGYLKTHQSLANYVTLDGAQTISGKKTFTGDIVVGSCTLHYDSTNACLQFNF